MIKSDELNVIDRGSGFTIGELLQQHKQLYYLRANSLVCLFDGLDSLLDFVNTNMKTAKQSRESSSDSDGGDFHAFETYKQTMDIFRGNPQQIVDFNPGELRIKDNNESGSNVDYDVTGDYIDMGRYMEGIPESVGTMHAGNARNRRVNIIINTNQWAGVKHDDIKHRGERILRLVDALEAGGVRTQLTAIDSNQCGHTEVILKRHDEPLTITDLAIVSHPEFKRRIIFRINEYSKTFSSGYGSPVVFSESVRPELLDSGNVNELDILIGTNLVGVPVIDKLFDQLEKLLVWEMSKPIPEVTSVKVGSDGIYFNPNGARAESEIRREGIEAINA